MMVYHMLGTAAIRQTFPGVGATVGRCGPGSAGWAVADAVCRSKPLANNLIG
jgi:hypothetical protein